MPKKGEITQENINKFKEIKKNALENQKQNVQFLKEIQNAIENIEKYQRIRDNSSPSFDNDDSWNAFEDLSDSIKWI